MVKYRRLPSADATQVDARLAPVFSIEPRSELRA